jgi:hypothetical protein
LPPLGKAHLAPQCPTCSQLNWRSAAVDLLVERVWRSSWCWLVHRQHRHAFTLGAYWVLEQTELLYEVTEFLCFISRVCIQRSSSLSSARRSVKMRTPLGQNARTGWISRKLNFQLVQPRLRAVNSRPRIEGKRLRCLSLLHADFSPWTETGGNSATHGLLNPHDHSLEVLLTVTYASSHRHFL